MGYRLYAEGRRSLLLVLQGMDCSGKDGTIRHVMQGFNPQSCQVTAFKQPGVEEGRDHFLRISRAGPRKGFIGIFNRSHYEDVLVVRVHHLVPKREWQSALPTDQPLRARAHRRRHDDRQGVSAHQQGGAVPAAPSAVYDPNKRWKFSGADVAERRYWDQYQLANHAALTLCNTPHVPWHIVPANHKWYRNLMVSRLLRKTLERMNPQYPPAEEGLDKLVVI